MQHPLRRGAVAAAVTALGIAAGFAPASQAKTHATGSRATPTVSDFAQMTHNQTPPTQADCVLVNRRCFDPAATQSAYDLAPLYKSGYDGSGETIAVVDSYGSDTMAHDLHVYDQAFRLQPMCGEEGVRCKAGMPKFSELHLQGSPATKAPPSKSQGTGLEAKSAWALEVALDVEVAHAMAPQANILLVATPTAETLGVQGLHQMMSAEQYVVDHHLADVISQSFGTGEEAFGSQQSLLNLRHAFVSAQQAGISVLASSGDGGTTNSYKEPVKNPRDIPFPSVSWPASDPLVTGIGGTYLCTDPDAAYDAPRTYTPGAPTSTNPEQSCDSGQAELGWVAAGGGFSHVFGVPSWQQGFLPAGSTGRGVPDVSLQASSRTGALVYLTLPPDGQSGLLCQTHEPCSTGWYDIGGTSLSSPEWAGIVAIADDYNAHHDLGLLNPALYEMASDPEMYAADFHDVTVGNNQTTDVPGYDAGPGWDPITGLGTPDAAKLVPDLVATTNAH